MNVQGATLLSVLSTRSDTDISGGAGVPVRTLEEQDNVRRLEPRAREWLNGHRYTEPSKKSALYALLRYQRAKTAEEWWRSLDHLAPSSRRAQFSVVSSFVQYLLELGELDRNPLIGISPPRPPRPNPVTFTAAEVDRVREACTNWRDRVIVELMWGIGLRCVEVSRLEVADVDLAGRYVTVHGKGGGFDVLPLPERVAWVLENYLEAHPATAGPLVRDVRFHRTGLKAQRVSDVMVEIMRRAGVKRRAYDGRSAHTLRRTCATDLLDAGANIRQVQAVLRHASLNSTEHYLRRSNAEDLRGVLDQRTA